MKNLLSIPAVLLPSLLHGAGLNITNMSSAATVPPGFYALGNRAADMSAYLPPMSRSGGISGYYANGSSLDTLTKGSPTNVMYVNSFSGSDANDGASWSNAKRTLLAAYDAIGVNGIVYFADQSLAGGATNQGLWFMYPTDPNFGMAGYPNASNPVGENGWRTYKPMKWVGVSSGINSGKNTPALILPGQGGCWDRSSSNKPAIWVAGANSGMEFWNMGISGASCCLRAGFSTTWGDASTAPLRIENCDFRNPQEISGDDGVSGPVIELGYVFWCDIRNTALWGYCTTNINPASDRRAVILCRPTLSRTVSPFLLNVESGVWSAGGVKYKPGTGTTTVTLSHIVEEGISTNPPIFWLTAPAPGYVWATDVIMADGPVIAGMAAIQIDAGPPGMMPGNVRVDTTSVNGPATILGEAPASLGAAPTGVPDLRGQIGFMKGQVWGPTYALRYNFPPVTVLWSNLCGTSLPANCAWTNDPIGNTNAVTGTGSGAALQTFKVCDAAQSISLGDWFVWGTWIRVPSGSVPTWTEGQFQLNILRGNKFSKTGNATASSVLAFSHEGWQWVSGFDVVTNVSSSPTAIRATIYYYTNNPVLVYNPTVLHIPASAGLGSNNVAQIATHMAGWPSGIKPGAVATQQGQALALYDYGSKAWRYLTISSNSPVVTDQSGVCLSTNPSGNPTTGNLATGGVILPSRATPPASAINGAQLWSDGTNLCVILKNPSTGVLTTNKATLTSWP